MLDHVDTRGRGSRERAYPGYAERDGNNPHEPLWDICMVHEARARAFEKIDRLKIDRWNSTVDLAMLAMASMSTWRSARCSGLGKTAPPRVTYQAKCQFGVSALLQVP